MTSELLEPRFHGNRLVLETASRNETYDARFLVAALLVYVAKGDGAISAEESGEMLDLISEHFHMRSAESLELLTRAMTSIAEDPGLVVVLRELGDEMSESDKREVAAMMVRVMAADGKVTADEMEALRAAADVVGINAGLIHEVYDECFAKPRS